ncbi:unnamed protein product, partial [Laminaria digitata]
TAAVGRSARASKRSCAWHPQPRYGRAPAQPGLTPNSLLRAIKLWYLMPALLHSPDDRIKRRQRFALVESGDIVLLLHG